MKRLEIILDHKDISYLQRELFVLLRDIRRAMQSDKREPGVVLHNCDFALGVAFAIEMTGVISWATQRHITEWVERRMYEVQHER